MLQIVALPELRVVWSARRSGQFPEVLIDAPDDELSQETVKSDEIIVEVLCYGMGFNQVGGILEAGFHGEIPSRRRSLVWVHASYSTLDSISTAIVESFHSVIE